MQGLWSGTDRGGAGIYNAADDILAVPKVRSQHERRDYAREGSNGGKRTPLDLVWEASPGRNRGMSVFVGPSLYPFGRMIMCHMVADTLDELHEMADSIGVCRKHFQTKTKPHYDISKSKRALAVEFGAIEATERQVLMILKQAEREEASYEKAFREAAEKVKDGA